jgi:soluble lytic murein transglycosylase-like protein
MNRIVQTVIASLAASMSAFMLAHADLRDWGDNYTGAKLSNPGLWNTVVPKSPTSTTRGDRIAVMNMVKQEASRQGVPHKIALAVAKVESGYSCHAVGPKTRHGRAMGPLQILPKSAARLGYPTTNLASCGNGLAAGMAHLAECYKLAGGDTIRTAACHVGGPGMSSGPRGKYANHYVVMVTNTLGRIE